MMRSVATVIVTAVLVSAFWVFYTGITGGAPAPRHDAPFVARDADGTVAAAGDKVTINPRAEPPVTLAESVEVGPSGLAVPVVGRVQLVDTFTQARAGGARVHDAIDIMAPEGTPVVAAAPGVVEKLYFSEGGGGITAYVRSPDQRWTYYYAHLKRYAPGLREGQRIARGTPIGEVGYTGNASPDGPHLHFAINRMNPGDKWYDGRPVNPYPLLAGRPARR